MLIIGAGPFGLAMAAYARHLGIAHAVVGKPMGFWTANMPRGMVLRSACDWHLDPIGMDTIVAFLETRGLKPADVEPISLEFYLSYAQWFQERKGIATAPTFVRQLDGIDDERNRFRATLDDGDTIVARNVVVAVGFKYFKHVPEELARRLPAGRYGHSCDEIDFTGLRGKRCLIVGGRQGGYEWAALAHEAGATAVHLSYRHDAPAFQAADWSWVGPLVDAMVDDPGWFRHLPQAEKDAVSRRLWAEGRLKIEPWLKPRIETEGITVWPRTQVVGCAMRPNGALTVSLDNGRALDVDRVILATGYKVNFDRVPFLAAGNLLPGIAMHNGFPILDEHLQTTTPGLFVTSMAAGQDFGPFFGFTISVRTSARLIGRALADAHSGSIGHPI
jgi:cation diffusion facilitator CzcD-associated flavoprotein CzcO